MKTLTHEQRQARVEDLAFMADHGVGLTAAADRIGITRDALATFLRRHNPELGTRLADLEPRLVESRKPDVRSARAA